MSSGAPWRPRRRTPRRRRGTGRSTRHSRGRNLHADGEPDCAADLARACRKALRSTPPCRRRLSWRSRRDPDQSRPWSPTSSLRDDRARSRSGSECKFDTLRHGPRGLGPASIDLGSPRGAAHTRCEPTDALENIGERRDRHVDGRHHRARGDDHLASRGRTPERRDPYHRGLGNRVERRHDQDLVWERHVGSPARNPGGNPGGRCLVARPRRPPGRSLHGRRRPD